jgi:hypothetical protein
MISPAMGLPVRFARPQVEAGQVMAPVALAVGVGHEDASAGGGWHTHERIAEPALPDRAALDGEHFQLAALGVERDEVVGDDGGRGAVVFRAVAPELLPGHCVDGVELVAAEAAAEEDASADDGRSRQRPAAEWRPSAALVPFVSTKGTEVQGCMSRSSQGDVAQMRISLRIRPEEVVISSGHSAACGLASRCALSRKRRTGRRTLCDPGVVSSTVDALPPHRERRMAAPTQQTPSVADCIVTAISPTLIMALVGSLVFFLLEVLYVGQYTSQLQWGLFFFVFAAVLIARLSIQSNTSSRASVYMVALAIPVWLTLQFYVEYPPDSPGAVEVVHQPHPHEPDVVVRLSKLTWDCTFLDEEASDGGRGLLDASGLQQQAPEEEDEDEPKSR